MYIEAAVLPKIRNCLYSNRSLPFLYCSPPRLEALQSHNDLYACCPPPTFTSPGRWGWVKGFISQSISSLPSSFQSFPFLSSLCFPYVRRNPYVPLRALGSVSHGQLHKCARSKPAFSSLHLVSPPPAAFVLRRFVWRVLLIDPSHREIPFMIQSPPFPACTPVNYPCSPYTTIFFFRTPVVLLKLHRATLQRISDHFSKCRKVTLLLHFYNKKLLISLHGGLFPLLRMPLRNSSAFVNFPSTLYIMASFRFFLWNTRWSFS